MSNVDRKKNLVSAQQAILTIQIHLSYNQWQVHLLSDWNNDFSPSIFLMAHFEFPLSAGIIEEGGL